MLTFPPAGYEDIQAGTPPLQLKSPANADTRPGKSHCLMKPRLHTMPLTEHRNETLTMWSGATTCQETAGRAKRRQKTHLPSEKILSKQDSWLPSGYITHDPSLHRPSETEHHQNVELFHTENMIQKASLQISIAKQNTTR